MSGNKISTVLLLIVFVGSNALSTMKLSSTTSAVCSGFYIPKAGGDRDIWDESMKFPFEENFEFTAMGNDMYLAVFENGKKVPSVALVIAGWTNSRTKVFNNGGIRTEEVCDVPMTITNPNQVNTFRVEFNILQKRILLFYNGKQYLNCAIANLTQSSSKTFVFSQYETNVKICKDFKVDTEPIAPLKRGCQKRN